MSPDPAHGCALLTDARVRASPEARPWSPQATNPVRQWLDTWRGLGERAGPLGRPGPCWTSVVTSTLLRRRPSWAVMSARPRRRRATPPAASQFRPLARPNAHRIPPGSRHLLPAPRSCDRPSQPTDFFRRNGPSIVPLLVGTPVGDLHRNESRKPTRIRSANCTCAIAPASHDVRASGRQMLLKDVPSGTTSLCRIRRAMR